MERNRHCLEMACGGIVGTFGDITFVKTYRIMGRIMKQILENVGYYFFLMSYIEFQQNMVAINILGMKCIYLNSHYHKCR